MIPKTRRWLPSFLLSLALGASASCSSGGSDYGNSPTAPGGGGGALELNSGNLAPGATYQHRFALAGTFNYRCLHHSPMTGSVVVSAAAPETLVNVSIVSSTTPFPGASVKPGGRVVWTNNDNSVHTVTSN